MKMLIMCPPVRYYSAMKDELESFVGKQVHLKTIMLSETNQTRKLKCLMESLI